MQHFEVTHWWKTYSATIDEDAGTLEICMPDKTYRYKLGDLGNVWTDSKSHVVDHGNQTDNIIQGAAIGGKAGAFVAAISPSGKSAYLTKLGLVVCRKMMFPKGYFNYPPSSYPDTHKDYMPLPANRKMERFARDVATAADNAIKAWLDIHVGIE